MPTWNAAWICTSPPTLQQQLEKSADSSREREATPKVLARRCGEVQAASVPPHRTVNFEPQGNPGRPGLRGFGDTDLLPARSDVMQMVARAGSRSQCLPARSAPSRGAARPESASAKSSMDPRLKRCTTNPACRRSATSHTRHYRAAEPRSGLHGRSQEARRARRLRTGRY